MKLSVDVSGLEEAIDEINSEVSRIENAAQAGFWEAGLKVLRAAQIELKKSVVTGNLRASGYVRNAINKVRPDPAKLMSGKNQPIPSAGVPTPGVEIGFTANYALWVHENMEGRSPKFLEDPVQRNKRNIIEIIRRRTGGE